MLSLMKTKYFALAALAFAALVSCNKETATVEQIPEPSVREGYVQITLSAGVDNSTKAVLDGSKVVWAVGEEVAVYPGEATTAEKFTVTAVDGSNVTISGSVPEGTTSLVAVYPFDNAVSRNGNSVKFSIPDSQNIPDDGNIDPEAMSSAAVYTDLTQKAQFKNLFALLAFNVGEMADANIVGLLANDDKVAVTGNVQAALSADADPVITAPDGEGWNGIEVFSDKAFTPKKTYYAVVAPCAVTGFTVGVGNDSKLGTVTSDKSFTLERNKGLDFGDVASKVTMKYSKIHNAAELQEFLSTAQTYAEGDEVALANDIDLTGVTLTSAASWAGTFDGCGHSLKNWTSAGVALFGTNTGTISNLKLDKTCTLSYPDPDAEKSFGFICCYNDGKLENCSNAANITSNWDFVIARAYYGSLVGQPTGDKSLIDGCSNSGNVTLTFAGQKDVPYFGNIAGRSIGANGQVTVKDCTNTGKLTIKNTGVGKNLYAGGLFGTVNTSGIIQNCKNSGEISYEFTAGGTGAYVNLGGVVGYTAAKMIDCSNTAAVTYTTSKENQSTRPNIGGVAGYVAGGITGSSNSGDVSVTGMFGATKTGSDTPSSAGSMPYPAIGGVAGCVGHASKTVICDDCHNTGKVTLDAAIGSSGYIRVGGVGGFVNASMNGSTNKGDVIVTSTGKQTAIGGIGGYCAIHKAGELEWKDCINEGDITLSSAQANTTFSYIGGIVGGTNSAFIITGCTNKGKITTTSPSQLRVGGIGGLPKVIENSANYGDISVTGATWGKKDDSAVDYSDYASSVGSIAGFAQGNIFGCTVKCSVSSNSQANSFIGGLVGAVGNTAQDFYNIDMDVNITASEGVCTGIIIGGQINNQKNVNMGLAGQPINIASSTKVNGAAVTGMDVASISKLVGHIETESGHAGYILLTNVILK